MNFVSRKILAAVLTVACIESIAQIKELPELKKEGIIADFKLAMDILKKQHPNPYKFIDSASFNRRVDSLLSLAGRQEDVFSMLQFSPIQLIRDVHTNLRFSDDNSREMISNIRFFPFPVLNFKNVDVVGQTTTSYPSSYTNLDLMG